MVEQGQAMTRDNSKKLRAVGYCRTSGEGQRDNTSIPRQKNEIERFIASNEWEFVGHYVDECKSGATVAGRDDFKRMLRGGANDEYDIVVPYV
jgi:DNA invertase Pin-like site-specific DNA recombinase